MTVSIPFKICLVVVICSLMLMKGSTLDLELQQAIQRAWIHSPALHIVQADGEMKEAEEEQAAKRPNPIASIQVDGVNGINRSHNNCNDQEISYSLTQLIELGGKRRARRQEATFETSLANYEIESIKLNLLRDVTIAFVEVAAAQEYLKLADEQRKIAEEVLSATTIKVQGGKISLLQQKKAELNRVTTALAFSKAKRRLDVAKKKLAILWGCSEPDFENVSFSFFEIQDLEELCHLISLQNQNLEVLKSEILIAAAHGALAVENAQRIPDLQVTAGYTTCNDNGGEGVLLGVSMPIPIFDRNQGNIRRAKAQLNQAYHKKEDMLLQQKIALEEVYEQFYTAYKESLAYRESLIPSAKHAFAASKDEYMQGKNDYLELLDAQRTLFDVQLQYIDILEDYHRKKAEVDRLVGLPLIQLKNKS